MQSVLGGELGGVFERVSDEWGPVSLFSLCYSSGG